MAKLKTNEEIKIMHEGGLILSSVLRRLQGAVKSGITTKYLDVLAQELILEAGARSSFLNYRGYPSVLCTSINHEIVHGLPSDLELKRGDLLKLDMGVMHKGFHTDSATTVIVGGVISLDKKSLLKKKLIKVTKEALELGIKKAEIGNTIGDVGYAIQKYVEKNGFNVVRDLVGHGIGRELHEDPQVPNYGEEGIGTKLLEGMVIAIEPMVVTGGWDIKEGPDGFVYETKDGGFAAHFEHTVAITKNGPMVLTR